MSTWRKFNDNFEFHVQNSLSKIPSQKLAFHVQNSASRIPCHKQRKYLNKLKLVVMKRLTRSMKKILVLSLRIYIRVQCAGRGMVDLTILAKLFQGTKRNIQHLLNFILNQVFQKSNSLFQFPTWCQQNIISVSLLLVRMRKKETCIILHVVILCRIVKKE